MPSDIFYGDDCQARIGIMADATTDPTVWNFLEFKTLNMTRDKGKAERPLVGRTLNNKLDPIKKRNGLRRCRGELVIDVDSRGLALVLVNALGQPTTTGPATGIYTHVWNSGNAAPVYFALQILRGSGSNKVRVYRGLTLASLSLDGKGDQANNFDISISVQGLDWDREDDWLGDDPADIFTPAPAVRAIMKLGGAAASNILSVQMNWNRKLAEGAFLSQTPRISELRPDKGHEHSGQCSVRAMAQAFDDLEDSDTENDIITQFTGLPTGHDIQIEHVLAVFEPAADKVDGPGLVERDFSWTAEQDATNAALKITIKNEVAAYS